MKISYDRKEKHHYLYEGNKNKAIYFVGSKNQCYSLLILMELDLSIPFRLLERWVKANQEILDSLDDNNIENYVVLTGWVEIKKLQGLELMGKMSGDLTIY